MEAAAVLRGGSVPKLIPSRASSSAKPMVAPWLCSDLRKPSSPWLSSGSTSLSIGLAWNPNRRYEFSAHCGNTFSVIFPKGPKDPLKSLLSLAPAKSQNGREGDSPASKIARIKNEALKLIVSGRCDAAEYLMRGLYAEEQEKPEEAYYALLALVEILIHLEKYEEALQYLDNDHGFIKSDVRPGFYKAIVHTMLGHRDEAKTCWESYKEAIVEGLPE